MDTNVTTQRFSQYIGSLITNNVYLLNRVNHRRSP